MRILITGASGYLGARFARHLKTAHPSHDLFLASRSGNCRWLSGLGEQVSLDLSQNEIPQLPPRLDVVVHLAALNEIDSSNETRALKVNVNGTWALIKSSMDAGVKHFVYASTVHIYGPLQGILTEDTRPIARHPYGFTHHMAETLFEYASSKYGVSAICLRYSNIIGAPVDRDVNRWSLLVNDLCRQAAITGKLVLKTPESQRDFLAMSDACRALELALTPKKQTPIFQTFNIARGENMSVRDMADLIAIRSKAVLAMIPSIVVDEKISSTKTGETFKINNSRALEWGWIPKGNLAQEIDETLALCAETAHV